STSKPTTRDGSVASASTYGAPPSASPPHRSAGGLCERTGADTSVRHTSSTRANARVDIIRQGLGYRDSAPGSVTPGQIECPSALESLEPHARARGGHRTRQ